MFKYKEYNCPKVSKGKMVKAIDLSFGNKYYEYAVIGKVICVDNNNILIDLGKNYKKIGLIDGWIADKFEEKVYGCTIGNYYWWVNTWKLTNLRNIDIE